MDLDITAVMGMDQGMEAVTNKEVVIIMETNMDVSIYNSIMYICNLFC